MKAAASRALIACSAVALGCLGPQPTAPRLGQAPHYAPTAWSTLHADSRNSDYAPFLVPRRSRMVWEALDGAALFVGPTLGPEGNIYATSGRGFGTSHLHAFDRDGQLLWKSAVMRDIRDLDYGAGINAPVVDDEGTVFVGDLDQLWAFESNGEVRWQASLRERGASGHFVTPILTKEGHVGGITTDGLVLFFERRSGAAVWEVVELPDGGGPPSQGVPKGLLGGGLLAPEFIQPMWDLIYGWEIVVANTPAVHPETGRIYITAAADSGSGALYAIDTGPAGPAFAFVTPMAAGSGTSPAISSDGKLVYASGGDGVMVAFDADDGSVVWRAEGVQAAASPTVGGDGTVYSFDGEEVVALDGASGAVVFRATMIAAAESWLEPSPERGPRRAHVNGVLTASVDKLLVPLDIGYRMKLGKGPAFLQPHRFAIATLDATDGRILGLSEMRDSCSALVVPDADGRIYVSLVAATTSMQYHGLNPLLPEALRTPVVPVAGLVAFEPWSAREHSIDVVALVRERLNTASDLLSAGNRDEASRVIDIVRAQVVGLGRSIDDAVRRSELPGSFASEAHEHLGLALEALEVSRAAADAGAARRGVVRALSHIVLIQAELVVAASSEPIEHARGS